MVLVGEAVDHRHARVRGEALDDRLLEGADHHDVDHPRDHARDVLDRLAARELRVVAVEVDRDAAQLVHARLERHAGARRRLLEHHRERAVAQRLVELVALEALLDPARAREQVIVLVASETRELQEVAGRRWSWQTMAVAVRYSQFSGTIRWSRRGSTSRLALGPASGVALAGASRCCRGRSGTRRSTGDRVRTAARLSPAGRPRAVLIDDRGFHRCEYLPPMRGSTSSSGASHPRRRARSGPATGRSVSRGSPRRSATTRSSRTRRSCARSSIRGVKAVIVGQTLEALEPRLYHFLLGFARDNELQTAFASGAMAHPDALSPPPVARPAAKPVAEPREPV